MIATSGVRPAWRQQQRAILAMGVVVTGRLPEMPGVADAHKQALDVVVHAQRDAVNWIGFVELAADDGCLVELFREITGRVDQQRGGGEGDGTSSGVAASGRWARVRISLTSSRRATRLFQVEEL